MPQAVAGIGRIEVEVAQRSPVLGLIAEQRQKQVGDHLVFLPQVRVCAQLLFIFLCSQAINGVCSGSWRCPSDSR